MAVCHTAKWIRTEEGDDKWGERLKNPRGAFWFKLSILRHGNLLCKLFWLTTQRLHLERNEISPLEMYLCLIMKNTAFVIAVTICNLITRHVVPSKLVWKRIACVCLSAYTDWPPPDVLSERCSLSLICWSSQIKLSFAQMVTSTPEILREAFKPLEQLIIYIWELQQNRISKVCSHYAYWEPFHSK